MLVGRLPWVVPSSDASPQAVPTGSFRGGMGMEPASLLSHGTLFTGKARSTSNGKIAFLMSAVA